MQEEPRVLPMIMTTSVLIRSILYVDSTHQVGGGERHAMSRWSNFGHHDDAAQCVHEPQEAKRPVRAVLVGKVAEQRTYREWAHSTEQRRRRLGSALS